jgi:hypothetical protein
MNSEPATMQDIEHLEKAIADLRGCGAQEKRVRTEQDTALRAEITRLVDQNRELNERVKALEAEHDKAAAA